MSHITVAGRRALARSQFALPPRKGKTAKRVKGSYPIDTAARGRDALSRGKAAVRRGRLTKSQYETIVRRVHAKYPNMQIGAIKNKKK